MGKAVRITWLGHSCFRLEKDGYTIILDPYRKDSVPGLLPLSEQADLVLCSHEHGDHSGRACVSLREGAVSPFSVERFASWHDDQGGMLRGENAITLITGGDFRLVHLGDLGCGLDPKTIERLSGADVLLIPVGGYYTIGPKEAAKIAGALSPKTVVPMHYRDDARGIGFAEIGTVQPFLEEMGSFEESTGACFESDQPRRAPVLVLIPEMARKRG